MSGQHRAAGQPSPRHAALCSERPDDPGSAHVQHAAGAHANHGHPHGDLERRRDRRRLGLALIITATLCVAEFVGGYIANSLALISDAGHMLSDVLGEVLALLALIWADRPANKRKTFGYHRVEILMALGQGTLLILLASGVLVQAVRRLWHLETVHTDVMLWIAALGLVGNIACALLLHGGSSLNVRGAYLHVLLDGLSSVAVMLVGLLLWLRPSLLWLDPLLSIAISQFIYYSAYRLAREAVDILLEAVPQHLDVEKIAAVLATIPGVKGVHHLHVWTITSGMPALSAHLLVECAMMSDSDALLQTARQVLQQHFMIRHVTLQVESNSCAPASGDGDRPVCVELV